MAYVIVLILLTVSELIYFRIARRFDIVTKPTLRSSHARPTLQGGGIIFLIAAVVYELMFPSDPHYLWAIAGLTLAGGVSFIDDIRALSKKLRLLAQFVAVLLLFMQFGIFHGGNILLISIGVIGCVGALNAFNFMDGINGITGLYSFSVLLPLVYLNFRYGFIAPPYLYVAGISLLVFSFFNVRKHAKCFAGDVGAISIAMILLFALGSLILKTHDFSYIGFLALYGVDVVMTICHRIKLHENLGEAHRKHAYQLMANELGIPGVMVAAIYMAIQLLISAGLIFLPVNRYIYLAVVLVLLAAAYIVFMTKNYHLHADYLKRLGK